MAAAGKLVSSGTFRRPGRWPCWVWLVSPVPAVGDGEAELILHRAVVARKPEELVAEVGVGRGGG